MKIDLKAKLSAYTKGILPTKVSQLENDLDYVIDVEADNVVYGRRATVDIESGAITHEWVKTEWVGTEEQLDEEIELHGFKPEITYYVVEDVPNLYVDGGTSFTNVEEGVSFEEELNGGSSSTSSFEIELKPINSKGVTND